MPVELHCKQVLVAILFYLLSLLMEIFKVTKKKQKKNKKIVEITFRKYSKTTTIKTKSIEYKMKYIFHSVSTEYPSKTQKKIVNIVK